MKVLRRLWPVVLVIPVLAVVWAAHAHGGEAPPVGRALAANCFQCHGTDGHAVNGMPSIAGKDAPSMYHKMLEYKERTDFTNIMVPIAHAYTDQELWELSLYIASIPEHPGVGEGDDAAEPDDTFINEVETGGGE